MNVSQYIRQLRTSRLAPVSLLRTMKSFALRDGMRIAYQEWGSAQSAKKIVAVHGWLDNSNSFHLLGPKVAALGYHCVAIDLIGHGKSSHIGPEAIYTTPNGVAYMNEIVDNLGWASTDVLGMLLLTAIIFRGASRAVILGLPSRPQYGRWGRTSVRWHISREGGQTRDYIMPRPPDIRSRQVCEESASLN
jgi:hypothetical protein